MARQHLGDACALAVENIKFLKWVHFSYCVGCKVVPPSFFDGEVVYQKKTPEGRYF